MKPTTAFDAFIEEAAGQEEPEEGATPIAKYTFNWWAKSGLLSNMDKIITEFNEHNNLKPIRVFVTGPPAVGKSYWA
jgi:hypothetical protein